MLFLTPVSITLQRKVSFAQQKHEIALARAFSYTYVLQDGSQYTDLYEASRSFFEMTRKLKGVYKATYIACYRMIAMLLL